jgi:hypothetical protein
MFSDHNGTHTTANNISSIPRNNLGANSEDTHH